MIPVNTPWIHDDDRKAVMECLEEGWISSSGPYLTDFERHWAAYCGRRHGIAVANGTAALQLAIAALDLPAESEIILPSFTIVSCAMAVVYNSARPVLVDSDPRTGCMDVEAIEKRISPATRAIMPVHIYGHPVAMDRVLSLAEKHGLKVVEDAAEAHGAQYKTRRSANAPEWKRCGSFGDASCFSFYANKLVTTGEGGMVVTDDDVIAGRVRSLRNLCFEAGRRFQHNHLGYNYRMTSLQAALALGQIARMEEIIECKRSMAAQYDDKLKDIAGLQLPIEESWARSVYWMYGVQIQDEAGMTAEMFAERLKKRGVETRPFFLGMHEQPVLQRMGLFTKETYPVSERMARRGLYLPSGLGITASDIDHVAGAVREVLD